MCVGIYCVCSCMGCLSQNVCTAASAAAGAGRVVPEKQGEKQEEGGDQDPPLALGNIDLTLFGKRKHR